MVDLTYFPGIVPFVIGLYLVIVIPIYIAYFHMVESADVLPVAGQPPQLTPLQQFLRGREFPCVYQSCWGYAGAYLLLAWRLSCFCYFFGIVFLWGYIRNNGNNAYYFTLWNVDFICVYFLLASIASIIGVRHMHLLERDPLTGEPLVWPESMHRLGYTVQILFEVGSSTAFFITALTFVTFFVDLSLWNISWHLMNTVSFAVEMSLNKIPVRHEHVVFQLSWALLYLIFIWPMVAAGALQDWPYFFMDTSTRFVYAWYTLLWVVNLGFFYLSVGAFLTKEYCFVQVFGGGS